MTREEARQEIKKRIPCTDYLDRSKGTMYCCPFCGSGTGANGTGALKYYESSNTCACFGMCAVNAGKPNQTGVSYDVLDIIAAYHGTDHNGAMKKGADKLGIVIDGHSDQTADKKNSAQTATVAAEQKPAANYRKYYYDCIDRLKGPEGKACAEYLAKRGISLRTADRLCFGYDPKADPANAPGAMGNEYRPHPAPRLIIPTSDSHYVGRRIDGIDEYPKLNAQGSTPGLLNQRSIYSGRKGVFVVEGAMDAASIEECGYSAVALNSVNNGGLLIEQLKKKPAAKDKEFYILLDNEEEPDKAKAVRQAAEALKSDLVQLGYKAVVVDEELAPMHDANEYLVSDRELFETMLSDCESIAIVAYSDEEKAENQKDSLDSFLEKIQTEAYKPLATGLTFFDDLLGGGVIPQSILILMAAPGTGKTTLCQQLGEAMAEHGRPVVYINLEMSAEQMIAKSISRRLATGGIYKTATGIMQGYNWTEDEREAILQEFSCYRSLIYPYMKYNPGNIGSNLDSILEYLQKLGSQAQAAGKPGPVVILDYLHLVSSKKNMETAELIKQAITGLKSYAVDYNTFCIAIAATNRTSNSSGKITMESGRDSSNIEYTGDYQLAMNFWETMNGIQPAGETPEQQRERLLSQDYREMGLQILKNRFGMAGKKEKFYFRADASLFLSEMEYRNTMGSTDDLPPEWLQDSAQQATVWGKSKKGRR